MCRDEPPPAGRLVHVMDPRQLYTLDEAVVAKLKDHRPVLIHQLDGFVDAGQAGRLFSANLLENLEHEVLAEFDHDQLHDYRSRRPAMIFDTNQWKSYADLHLRIYRVTDGHGEVFLLFSGPEPDVQWERLSAAMVGLIEQFGVRMTVGIHGIPMAVPHTRPITLTAHATDASLTPKPNRHRPAVTTRDTKSRHIPWRAGSMEKHLLEWRNGNLARRTSTLIGSSAATSRSTRSACVQDHFRHSQPRVMSIS